MTPASYMSLLVRGDAASRASAKPSYLSLLEPLPPVLLPEGALAGSTAFARAYNALLPHRHRLTTIRMASSRDRPQSRRPLLDGEPLVHDRLVMLARLVNAAGDESSIDVVSRAAWAHAFANPAADPWLNALRGWLADEIVTTVYAASSMQEGALASITFASRDRPGERVPHWFVSTRAIKAELNAYGPHAMRRIRAAMHALGWRERKCFAWGGRMWGFVRACEGAPCVIN